MPTILTYQITGHEILGNFGGEIIKLNRMCMNNTDYTNI